MEDLSACKLCQGIPPQTLEQILRKTMLRTCNYRKGDVVAFEEDECTSLGIILSGSVTVQRLLPSGKQVAMDTLQTGDSFGEVIIFSDQQVYPATIVSEEDTKIAFISKEDVLRLCLLSPVFLNNFVSLLSNKILMLNRKIKNLSFSSVRQKTAHYLLEAYRAQQSTRLKFNTSRSDMANQLGIPRPSLSRELAAMQAEGLIEYERGNIHILAIESLEACLSE
jgi:CRP-like cAMP-binding protein